MLESLELFQANFSALGYEMVSVRDSTYTALAVCYKTKFFENACMKSVSFPISPEPVNEKDSRQPVYSIIVSLRFKKKFSGESSRFLKSSLVIANTDFQEWQQSEKNAYQTAEVMKRMWEFKQRILSEFGLSKPYVFLTGNFNFAPKYPAYVSLVSKPFHINKNCEEYYSDTQKIEAIHNDIPLKAVSLYAVGYRYTVPEKHVQCSRRNEPRFALFDIKSRSPYNYIFVVCEWQGENGVSRNSLRVLCSDAGVKLLSLLNMPVKACECELVPAVGKYPSSELSMMARVELV